MENESESQGDSIPCRSFPTGFPAFARGLLSFKPNHKRTMNTVKECTSCKGSGRYHSDAFTGSDGKLWPAIDRDCYSCDGRGTFEAPDVAAIWAAIKGRKPGTVRSKRPDDGRAYFVWRMVRFHTGADVTLPMVASMEISGDPFRDDLDRLAEIIAAKLTGHRSVGVTRWRAAMYGETDPFDPLMPASAYSGGPVADACKPETEVMELF